MSERYMTIEEADRLAAERADAWRALNEAVERRVDAYYERNKGQKRRATIQTRRAIEAIKAAGFRRSEFSVRTPRDRDGYGETYVHMRCSNSSGGRTRAA